MVESFKHRGFFAKPFDVSGLQRVFQAQIFDHNWTAATVIVG